MEYILLALALILAFCYAAQAQIPILQPLKTLSAPLTEWENRHNPFEEKTKNEMPASDIMAESCFTFCIVNIKPSLNFNQDKSAIQLLQ